MSEVTDAISEHVRKGIAAQDAADRAAGRMTAGEHDQEVLIGERRARLAEELATAIAAARSAGGTLAELAGYLYDGDYADSELGSDLAELIETARRALTAAQAQLVQ